MSTNAKTDRRVSKTKQALHDALEALIRERDYDDISVQEILDRANVGRSTFYMHYGDKDELLVNAIHDMIRAVSNATSAAKAAEDLTWFSLPILEHHQQHQRDAGHRVSTSARNVLHERLSHVLSDLVKERLTTSSSLRTKTMERLIPPDLLAPYISSTFVLVLNWWLDQRAPPPARDVHELFRSLVGRVAVFG